MDKIQEDYDLAIGLFNGKTQDENPKHFNRSLLVFLIQQTFLGQSIFPAQSIYPLLHGVFNFFGGGFPGDSLKGP
jgi:hypothetical protein